MPQPTDPEQGTTHNYLADLGYLALQASQQAPVGLLEAQGLTAPSFNPRYADTMARLRGETGRSASHTSVAAYSASQLPKVEPWSSLPAVPEGEWLLQQPFASQDQRAAAARLGQQNAAGLPSTTELNYRQLPYDPVKSEVQQAPHGQQPLPSFPSAEEARRRSGAMGAYAAFLATEGRRTVQEIRAAEAEAARRQGQQSSAQPGQAGSPSRPYQAQGGQQNVRPPSPGGR